MKKALFICCFAMVSCFPLFADIASGKDGNLEWVITDGGTLIFSGVGAMPDYQTGQTPWYAYRHDVKVGIVGDKITTIGQAAFQHLDKMTSVYIPASVRSIGGWGFYGCTSLVSLELPRNIQTIGPACFAECYALNMVIMHGTPTLGWRCFWSCKSLTLFACYANSTVPYVNPKWMFSAPNEPFGGSVAPQRMLLVRNDMVQAFQNADQWNTWTIIRGDN